MLEFQKINEKIDLFSKYKDNPDAQLTLFSDWVDKYSDYVCYHIHSTYFANQKRICTHIMARSEYLEDENLILYAEDNNFKDIPFVRIYSKYNINTFELDILIIKSSSNNTLFDRD